MKINKYFNIVHKAIDNCINDIGYKKLDYKSPIFKLEYNNFKLIITETDKFEIMVKMKIVFNKELEFDEERIKKEIIIIEKMIEDNFKIGTQEEKNRQMFLNILLR